MAEAGSSKHYETRKNRTREGGVEAGSSRYCETGREEEGGGWGQARAGTAKLGARRRYCGGEVERAVQPAAQQAAAAFVQAQRVDGLLVVAGAVQQLAAAQQVPHLKLRAARHRTKTA